MTDIERDLNRMRQRLNNFLSQKQKEDPAYEAMRENALANAGKCYAKGFVLITLAIGYFENALELAESTGYTNLAINKANLLMEDSFDVFWKTLCTQLHITKEQMNALSKDCDNYRIPLDNMLDGRKEKQG